MSDCDRISGSDAKLVVLIDPNNPLRIGESLSGAKALFIPYTSEEEWLSVENSEVFKILSPDEQRVARIKFPIALRRYRELHVIIL